MSITQTKFRKGYVETPILKTDDIEYMGHQLPLYDVVTESIIQTPKDKSVEIGASTTYQEVLNNHIRLLTRSPFFDDNSLFTLKQIDLHFGGTDSRNEFISLCIFGLRNGSYVFLGESTNAYLRPRTEITLPFYFNTELFEILGEGIMPYAQIFIRARLCQIDEHGMMIGGEESYEWDDASFTTMRVKGCNKNNISYNPYIITDGDDGITPHIKLLYSAANLGVGDKIPHNLNAEVHLTPRDKENVERLSELGSAVLMEEQKHIDVIDTRYQTRNYAKTGVETIVSVLMNPNKWIGLLLEEIEIRRGSINQVDRITDKWLQADCFDVNGNLIDTHFSTYSNSQTTTDGGKTKWKFSNFEIKDTYNSIEFRMSDSGTVRQQTYINFAGSSLQNSSNVPLLYESGWVTKWAVYQNVNNISTQQFTADFVLTFKPKIITGLKFIQHITDEEVHITPEEKDLFHDLASEIVSDTKTRLLDTRQLVPQTINDIQAEQIWSWDMGVTENERNYNFEELVLRRKDNVFSGVHAADNDCWVFADCYNNSNQIIHTAYSINTQRQNSNDGLKSTWQFQDFVIPNDCVKIRFSLTKTEGTREPNTNKIRSTSLKNGEVKLLVGENWKTINQVGDIEQFTSDFSVTLSKKISVISSHIKNQTIHVTEDEKEKINTIDSIRESAAQALENHINTDGLHWTTNDRSSISTISNDLTNHIADDDIHVTAGEKEKWNNIVIPEPITYTAGNAIDITDNSISVITTDVIEESNKIPTSNALYNTFYGTRTFNNYDSSKYTESADSVGTIVLSKKHFIKEGKITKITLPHDKDSYYGEGGYLVVEVFAEDLSNTDGYDKANPIHRFYSDNNYDYQANLQKGKYEWTFNNTECLIPSDYKVVHLSVVNNNTTVPSIGSSNNKKIRINCLAKNGDKNENVVYEEDDECRLYWKDNNNPNVGGANFVAIVQVEFIGNKLDDFSIVPTLLQRIAALEARVSELENS